MADSINEWLGLPKAPGTSYENTPTPQHPKSAPVGPVSVLTKYENTPKVRLVGRFQAPPSTKTGVKCAWW
jgi:hypothetical protein